MDMSNVCSICLGSININDDNQTEENNNTDNQTEENNDTNNTPIYKLPCGHIFHTKCIVEWFRVGSGNCPLCNDNPQYSSNGHFVGYSSQKFIEQRCNLIKRKYNNKKDCPKNLKNNIEKLKKLQKDYKAINKERIEFLNKPEIKTYEHQKKLYYKNSYKLNKRITNQQFKIISMFPGQFIL